MTSSTVSGLAPAIIAHSVCSSIPDQPRSPSLPFDFRANNSIPHLKWSRRHRQSVLYERWLAANRL